MFINYNWDVNNIFLLYLPTQIRFLIGGERVTCRGSKLTSSIAQTKLTNSLGKQQLKLSTRTWLGPSWTLRQRHICVSGGQMLKRHWSRATFRTIEGLLYSRKRIVEKTDQIKGKIWTFCVFKLLIWRQKWVVRVWQLALQPLKMLLFKATYAVPRQIKPRIF